MTRVANVIEDGRVAGPHLRIIEVARRLAADGISTTVIHPWQDSGDLTARLLSAKVRSLPLRMTRPHSGWRGVFWYALTLIPDISRLYRLVQQENFDIVHCSGGAWQFKGVIAGRLADIPVIWHLNDTSMPWLVRVLFALLARWGASGFIVAGQRVREYYRLDRWAQSPVIEITPPVDTAAFNPAIVQPDPEIESLPGIKIVLVANVNPLKGIHRLLDAASLLQEGFQNLAFVIVGPIYQSQQQYFKWLLRHAQKIGIGKIVHFVGPKEDVASALAAADIAVCASLFEAGPMAVWEAMAMARPVVSTDVGDVARFISNGESGIVVAPNCAVSLATGIARFLDDPKLRISCGELARSIAIQKLDISICASLHAECYRLVAARQTASKPVVRHE
jgi:glycosyltransferase involved in cell wall biosynthesis